MRASKIRLVMWIALLAPLLIRCGKGWRQDELECQQAANQLVECCPGFTAPQQSCSYEPGCENQASYAPALTIAESQCVAAESCEELVSTGVCTRAASAFEQPDYGSNHPQVCP